MKKIATLLLLAFFSTLAFATVDSDSTSPEELTQTEQEILVAPVGFDKVLSLIIFDIDSPQIEVKLSQEHTGFSFKTSLRMTDSEVIEMDLNDFEGGIYTLTLTAGEYTHTQTVIFP